MSELLPCPFCGCEAEIITTESIHGGDLFGIMCKYCCSRGDFHHTEAQAIDAWNSRAERVTDDEWESYQNSVPATEENMAKFGWVRERTCDLLKQRIAELESLVLYMHNEMYGCKYYHDCGFCEFDKCIFEKHMAALGLLRGDVE